MNRPDEAVGKADRLVTALMRERSSMGVGSRTSVMKPAM